MLPDAARAHAARVDERVRNGEDLPLAGVPLAVKDNMCLTARARRAAARFSSTGSRRTPRRPWQRMLEAGAIPIGKTNCDEFAMGSSCENSALGRDAQSLRSLARAGRIERRFRRGGRRLRGGDRLGQRYGRFDSRTGCVLQPRRLQADVWARFALRA